MPRQPATKLAFSDAGARFLARFEGFVPKPYNDADRPPNATIGFGHVLHPGPVTLRDRLRYRKGLTVMEGLKLLRADARTAETCVAKHVRVPLFQHEFDALVSFVFNIGCAGFSSSTALRYLNENRRAGVPEALAMWNRAGGRELEGLGRRRKAEGDLFTTGRYQ